MLAHLIIGKNSQGKREWIKLNSKSPIDQFPLGVTLEIVSPGRDA